MAISDPTAGEWTAGETRPRPDAIADAVEKAYEDSRDDVYRYLLSLGVWPGPAQEATQDVFLRLYVALRKGERILSVRGWIFRVAHNHGLKIRARESGSRPFDASLEDTVRSGEESQEDRLIEREKMLRVHRAVSGLSEQQKHCLELRAEGLRYAEIAGALGISVSAVGEFLRRAITRLGKARHE